LTPSECAFLMQSKDRRIAELEEEVRALKAYMRPPAWMSFPMAWGLKGGEAKILQLLLEREVMTIDQAMDALYFDRPDWPEPKIISVRVCTLRRKLDHLGVEIETVWQRRAYFMTAENKALVRSLLGAAQISRAA
jgi:DNA-binding response OmpR family regulator